MTSNTDWGQDHFVKGATENDIVKYSGTGPGDNKWVFTNEQSGNYKITVNLNTMRVTFTKLESKVYLCDGAFGGEWSNYTTEMNRKMADELTAEAAEIVDEAMKMQNEVLAIVDSKIEQ